MRKLIGVGIAILLILSATTSLLLNCLGANDNSWISKADMKYVRSGFGAAVVGEKIFVFGGVGEKGYCTATERYDPVVDVWTTKASIPTHRSHFGVAACGDKIYCIGGQCINDPFAYREQSSGVNEVYDPATDSWKTLAPMPSPQYSIQANTVNGKIYVIGGYINDANASNLNQVYDPASNSWSTRTPIPTGVYDYTSAVVGNKIYVFSNNLTQIYDTYYDSWSTGSPAPSPVIMGSSVTASWNDVSKRIYVFAANTMPWFNSTTKALTTQCYNPETDRWTNGTAVLTCRYYSAAVNINQTIYVIGGFTTPISNGQVSSYVDCAVNEMYTPSNAELNSPVVSTQPYGFDWIIILICALLIVIAVIIGAIVYLKKRRKK